MGYLIETEDLTKHFGSLQAVDGVTLSVAAGEILVLLGPNGAGKTTTIRMLASILRPTRGWARVAGFDSVQRAQEVRRRVGLLTEHHGLYTRMRAFEYLVFFGQVYGLPEEERRKRALDLMNEFGLEDVSDRRLGQFSKGMRQKLAMIRALLHRPSVLLLDEPTSALDPASARLVRESISLLRSTNRAVVVCTHNLSEAERLADRIAIIVQGRIVALGTPSELRRRFLGDPIMELRLAGTLDGAMHQLPDEVRLLSQGSSWIRYQVADPERSNPRVLRSMAQDGIQVVTLSEVGRSLEDVYLRVIGDRSTTVEENS